MIFEDIYNFLKGLRLTFKYCFSKPITIQYPKQRRKVEEGYRGLHALMRYPDTGEERCVGCCLCAAICPSEVITIIAHVDDRGERIVDDYIVDIGRCLFCGLCQEVCPKDAIVLTDRYELAVYDRSGTIYHKEDLLKIGEEFSKRKALHGG